MPAFCILRFRLDRIRGTIRSVFIFFIFFDFCFLPDPFSSLSRPPHGGLPSALSPLVVALIILFARASSSHLLRRATAACERRPPSRRSTHEFRFRFRFYHPRARQYTFYFISFQLFPCSLLPIFAGRRVARLTEKSIFYNFL